MEINLNYDKEFDESFGNLKKKYPKTLFEIEGISEEQLDMATFGKNFFSKKANETSTSDHSVDSNANVWDMSVVTYGSEMIKPFQRLNSLYMLWKYGKRFYGIDAANDFIEGQVTGDYYINDFHHFFLKPYCFNYSTYDVHTNGLPYLQQPKCIPPKHALTFIQQMEQFTAFASNNQSGATGQADFLIILSYYIKKMFNTGGDMHFKLEANDQNLWSYVKDLLTTYVYTINQPFKSNESPFTNVSVYDDNFLDSICEGIIFQDGSAPDKEIIKKLQEVLLDIMNEELDRTPMTFPIITACFSVDEEKEIKDEVFLDLICEKNLKWGFINIFTGDSSLLSSCCRLRSSQKNEYFNSFGAGSSKIGSMGVVTLNIPRLAARYKHNKTLFFQELETLTAKASKINNIKRHVLCKRIENGNLPLYTHGYMDLNKQYSTVGVTGLNEAIEIMGFDVLTEEGKNLQMEIIQTINRVNDKMGKQYKCPTNTEQIPAESVAVKLCAKDRLLKHQEVYEIYSNQFIPLINHADMLDRIELQGIFDGEFSGGSILHINCDARLTDVNTMKELIKVCAKKGVLYFAVNYNMQQCEDKHLSVGSSAVCSICGKRITDNYTRVVGFLVNTKNWNKTRREIDYPNRVFYKDLTI